MASLYKENPSRRVSGQLVRVGVSINTSKALDQERLGWQWEHTIKMHLCHHIPLGEGKVNEQAWVPARPLHAAANWPRAQISILDVTVGENNLFKNTYSAIHDRLAS